MPLAMSVSWLFRVECVELVPRQEGAGQGLVGWGGVPLCVDVSEWV